MTITQKYFLGAEAVILASLVGSLIAYPHLPSVMPMHWDAHGHVNGWGPKWVVFAFGPGVMTLMVLIFAAIPWLSPKQFEVESFRTTYLYLMVVIISLEAYVQLLIVLAGLGIGIDISRAMVGGICLMFTLMGNVLGKVRRNFFIGIRTPWTLASEPVWNATHRFGALTFFAGGLTGLFFAIFNAPFWLPMTAIVASGLAPVVYSLVLYKRLERQGAL
jgi:uncharacterized membrane protein